MIVMIVVDIKSAALPLIRQYQRRIVITIGDICDKIGR